MVWALSRPSGLSLLATTSVVLGSVLVIRSCYTIVALKRRKRELPFADIPYAVPDPHWLLGHLALLGSDVIDGQRKVTVDYAGSGTKISTFWTLSTPVFSVLDAHVARRLLSFTSERRGMAAITRHFTRMFGRNSLLMINGRKWRTHRDVIQRAFKAANLRQMQATITTASLRVNQAVGTELERQGGLLRIGALHLSRMASLDIFGLSCLAYDFGCTKDGLQESQAFRDTLHLQQELTRRCYHERFNPAAQYYWIPTPANLRHRQATASIRSLLRRVIQERRSRRQEGHDEYNDLLSSVLKGCKDFGEDASDDFLSDWFLTALFGGYETNSIAMTMTLYLLARHPEYQDECSKEATAALTAPSALTDAAQTLPFNAACLREALRCYPPTTVTARNLHKPFTVDVDGRQVVLPTGTRCFFSLYWIHHSELNFARADEFLPERWVRTEGDRWVERSPDEPPVDGIAPGDHHAHLAFSAGARNCVGQTFAVPMLTTVLASLCRSFRFEIEDPDYEMRLIRYGASQVPSADIPLVVRLRV